MEFEVRIINSVREVKKEIWDRCNSGLSFNSHNWYQFGENARKNDKPVYILLFHQGELIARAAFWVSWQEPLPISSEPVRRLVARMLHRWPMMICRTPVMDATGLSLPSESALRTYAIETIARKALQVAQQYKVSFVLFPYLLSEEAQAAGWLSEYFAVDLPGPSTCLEIQWSDFESYLKQLPRATRTYYRHNRNRADDLDMQVETSKQPVSPELVTRMIRNVEKHHGSPPNPWVTSIMENAGSVNATWFTARSRGQAVGSLLTFQEKESGLLSLIGLDYDVPYAYFQLLYEAIRAAIGTGVKRLWAGTGAYQFKQSMGFELVNNTWAVFASRQKSLQTLARLAVRWVN
jgi:predicted N-acyltransferase